MDLHFSPDFMIKQSLEMPAIGQKQNKIYILTIEVNLMSLEHNNTD